MRQLRTEAQKAAARANGAKSRGPATQPGKRASSLNSIKHGFLAQSLVLPGESRERFNLLFDELWHQFQPQNPVEEIQVQRMVAAQWRLLRVWAFENAGMLHETANTPEPELPAIDGEVWQHPAARSAAAFQSLHGRFGIGSVIQLSEMRYQRQFAQAHAQLLQARALATKIQEKQLNQANEPGDVADSK